MHISMAPTKPTAFNSPMPSATSAGPGQNPASADNESPIDLSVGRQSHGLAQKGCTTTACDVEGHHAHRDGTQHDQLQRWIPGAGEVEKPKDLRRVGHAGNQQSKTEDQAAQE